MLDIEPVSPESIPAAPAPKTVPVRAVKVTATDQAVQGAVDPAEVSGRVEAVNSFMSALDVDLRFELFRDSGSLVIFVVDGTTGDVIRRIPPEYFLQATLDLTGVARRAGIILDEGA